VTFGWRGNVTVKHWTCIVFDVILTVSRMQKKLRQVYHTLQILSPSSQVGIYQGAVISLSSTADCKRGICSAAHNVSVAESRLRTYEVRFFVDALYKSTFTYLLNLLTYLSDTSGSVALYPVS